MRASRFPLERPGQHVQHLRNTSRTRSLAVRVVVDTDMAMGAPGSEIDDGFALALLLADETFDVELVTSVNGNIDVESGTYLSGELLRRLGRPDIPVIRGAAAPMVEPEKVRGAPEEVRAAFGHHQPAP